MTIIERLESALDKAKENVFEKHMPPKDSDIDVVLVDAMIKLKDMQQQIEELHASREALLEYKSKIESEDYVLVPRKPTEEMIYAGEYAINNCQRINAQDVYKSMIKALEK